MSDEAIAPKLCYAPSSQIPHQPHTWADFDSDSDVPRLVPRHCDGWAAVLPDFIQSLRENPDV